MVLNNFMYFQLFYIDIIYLKYKNLKLSSILNNFACFKRIFFDKTLKIVKKTCFCVCFRFSYRFFNKKNKFLRKCSDQFMINNLIKLRKQFFHMIQHSVYQVHVKLTQGQKTCKNVSFLNTFYHVKLTSSSHQAHIDFFI